MVSVFMAKKLISSSSLPVVGVLNRYCIYMCPMVLGTHFITNSFVSEDPICGILSIEDKMDKIDVFEWYEEDDMHTR